MRKNYKLLNDYQNDLKAYDPKAKMTIMDLRKMAEYASIFDNETEKKLKKEITERANQTQGWMYQKDNKAACVDVNFFKKRGRKAPFYAAYVAVNFRLLAMITESFF